jgi:hypothetical protein
MSTLPPVDDPGRSSLGAIRYTRTTSNHEVPHSSPRGCNGRRPPAHVPKATQTIDTYIVRCGYAIGPKVQASNGATPLDFQFGPDGRLHISEAPASAVSSYGVSAGGTLKVITPSLSSGQGAACWLVVTSDGWFAYTANAATANVSQCPPAWPRAGWVSSPSEPSTDAYGRGHAPAVDAFGRTIRSR